MKIKFLGTAAAEGVPAIGCSCAVCRRARALGGKNMRSRSQALINGELLIEFNPDTVWHMHKYGLDLSKIDHCLITHSHPDHLYTDDIDNYRPDFCHGRENTMNFYAAKDGYKKINEICKRKWMKGAVTPHLVKAGKAFTVADGKYTVLPLPASHTKETSPVFYSISCDGKKLLYAHDTGYFQEEAWDLLEKEGRFDLVSLDCTGCLAADFKPVRHMNFFTDVEVLARMEKSGLADGSTVKVVNHFSHNGGQIYEDMLEIADKHGIIVSYDGLEIEF